MAKMLAKGDYVMAISKGDYSKPSNQLTVGKIYLVTEAPSDRYVFIYGKRLIYQINYFVAPTTLAKTLFGVEEGESE